MKYFPHIKGFIHGNVQAARGTQGTHTVHHLQNKMENAVSVSGGCGGRMQPTRLQSNKACLAVLGDHVERNPTALICTYENVISIRDSVELNLPIECLNSPSVLCFVIPTSNVFEISFYSSGQ